MKRKVMLPPEVSRKIGAMGLPRVTLIEVLLHIHNVLAAAYEFFREKRDAVDLRLCKYRKVILDEHGAPHQFTFVVDDTTSPDHLLIIDLFHTVNP